MKQQTKFKQTEIGKIPEGWNVTKLKDVCEQIFSGGTPNTQKAEYWNGNLRWLSSGETRQTFIRDTERKITQTGADNSSTRLAKEEDVVVAGAGQGHTRGQPSICLIDTYVNQSVVVLRSNKNKINPFFLFYNLLSRYNELRQLSDAHSSRGSLTTKLLADLSIKLPSIKEQEIASKTLLDLDFKIELNNKMNETLEAIGQILFKKWFVDGRKGGWKVSKIGDELKTVLGGTPDRTNPDYWNGNINWINSGKVNEFRILEPSEKITELGLNNSATKLLPKGTVVLAITGATLGQVSRLEIDTCANQSVIGIIENEKINSEYIYYWIKNEITNIISHQTGGAQQHINKNNVDNYKLLTPDKNTLDNFNKMIKPIFKQISINCFQSQKLSQIRDALLPKLMSGEIRVK